MILKKKDSREADISELNRLLTLKLTSRQRFLVDKELKCLVSGERNEQNSAYYLDFRYKDSPNWMLIHDLRLEHKGRTAQLDHVLINRYLDIYVLESKNYYYGVKIAEEGEFLVWDGKGYQAIESPYEQNRRHIQVLQQVVDERSLAPTRLGFAIPATYRNVILVAPTSKVIKPKSAPFDLATVVKADAFVSTAEKMFADKPVVEMAKIIGADTVLEFGKKLVRLHRPGSFNYAAKFGITEEPTPAPVVAPVALESVKEPPAPPSVAASACQECGAEVDKKVVYFCRMNKAKFNGQILCRDCQQLPPLEPV